MSNNNEGASGDPGYRLLPYEVKNKPIEVKPEDFPNRGKLRYAGKKPNPAFYGTVKITDLK